VIRQRSLKRKGLHRSSRRETRRRAPSRHGAAVKTPPAGVPSRLEYAWAATRKVRGSSSGRSVMRTAGFNVAATAAAGLGGVIIARTLGPTGRGDYAAVTSWFGIVLIIGGLGQPAALCFHVSRHPGQAREYVATARAMMLATGVLAMTLGILLAPVLAHGDGELADAYRIAFGASLITFVAASYTFSLQAKDIRRWNIVRLAQPLLSLAAIVVLRMLRELTLDDSMVILAGTMLAQFGWAYYACRVNDLAPGHASLHLVRPLTAYGAAQILAVAPATLNAQLDQLVLSQVVPAADLGRYAVAVSLTLLPVPLVAAIGNVAFPRLASQRTVTSSTEHMQRLAVVGSAVCAVIILMPLSAVAYWMVPLVFGRGYQGAVPLLWILAPGTVFLASGQVVGDLLRGRNSPITVAWAQGLAAVFTVVLLLILLPVVGVYGAAIASTVAYGVALAALLYRLNRLPGPSGDGNSNLPALRAGAGQVG
jgi:O-antigen/teichoic acid export membrane protein